MMEELYYLRVRGWCEEIPGEGGTQIQETRLEVSVPSCNQITRHHNETWAGQQMFLHHQISFEPSVPLHTVPGPSPSQDCTGEATIAVWTKTVNWCQPGLNQAQVETWRLLPGDNTRTRWHWPACARRWCPQTSPGRRLMMNFCPSSPRALSTSRPLSPAESWRASVWAGQDPS